MPDVEVTQFHFLPLNYSMNGALTDPLFNTKQEEEPNAPFRKGAQNTSLVDNKASRQLSSKISTIAAAIPLSWENAFQKDLTDLKTLSSQYKLPFGLGFEVSMYSRPAQKDLTTPTQPIKVNQAFSTREAFSKKLVEQTSVQDPQEGPFFFPANDELRSCLTKKYDGYPFAEYFEQKRITSKVARQFAGREFATIKEFNEAVKSHSQDLNENLRLTAHAIYGISLHIKMGLIHCAEKKREGAAPLYNPDFASENNASTQTTLTQQRFQYQDASLNHNQKRAVRISEAVETAMNIPTDEYGQRSICDGLAFTTVKAGLLTAASIGSEGVIPAIIVGIKTADGIAQQALPDVEGFLERHPVVNSHADMVVCSVGPEYCPPRYYGLAAKGVLKVINAASQSIDTMFSAPAKPVIKTLHQTGVTDSNVAQVYHNTIDLAKKLPVHDSLNHYGHP